MKKLQLITYNPAQFNDYNDEIDVKNFNNLVALDNYEIDVIDLSSQQIWENKGNSNDQPSPNSKMTSDFKSINQMIMHSKKARIVICLPQNVVYQCQKYKEIYGTQIKDMIPTFTEILCQLIPIKDLNIVYENSNTTIGTESIDSSFYFNNNQFDVLTISNDSEKSTTISSANIIVTTLNIMESKSLANLTTYLKEIKLIKDECDFPKWVHKYNFNDDEIQNNNIEQANEQIKSQKELIEKSKQKLQNNLRYKSILYNNSDALVEVVFEILEYLFDISLADFNDEKREDFVFTKDDVTFLGEIKGVTSNVKYEHISQLEVHYSKYLDKLQEENRSEDIKKILIINYERTKDIMVRDEINNMQIELAKKNETLIIDTKTLLIIYEKVLKKNLKRETIIDYIKNHSGIIEIDKIN